MITIKRDEIKLFLDLLESEQEIARKNLDIAFYGKGESADAIKLLNYLSYLEEVSTRISLELEIIEQNRIVEDILNPQTIPSE